MTQLSAIVLAAGHGKRMKSATPKVMHLLAGRPLVYYPVRAALDAGATQVVVVVGHGREQVEAYLGRTFGSLVQFAVQEQQRGTGHAALQSLPLLAGSTEHALIVYGDTPLLLASDLRQLHDCVVARPTAKLALLTCRLQEPAGYGRIMRDASGRVVEIREDRDLKTEQERAIGEVNPGVYCAQVKFLTDALGRLSPDNAQGELYLTEIVARAAEAQAVVDVEGDVSALLGINDRAHLSQAEQLMFARIAERIGRAGATVRVGALIDDSVQVAAGAEIEPFVRLRGSTVVGEGARIDVGCVVTDSHVGPGVQLKPYSVVTSSRIETAAQVGPFSHLRPESLIGEEAHVGNFVETKKTTLHRGAKANHLAYLGDGDVGEEANVGAGTIFCNYDGFQKHRTVIGKRAFIGSDSQIVAPVVIGDGAYVATGTTVTRDVPDDALAIGRVKQENKEGYASRLRAKLHAAAKAAKQVLGD